MSAVVKINNIELPECLVIVDTLSNEVTLETMLDNGRKLNMDKIEVEVLIKGNIRIKKK